MASAREARRDCPVVGAGRGGACHTGLSFELAKVRRSSCMWASALALASGVEMKGEGDPFPEIRDGEEEDGGSDGGWRGAWES